MTMLTHVSENKVAKVTTTGVLKVESIFNIISHEQGKEEQSGGG
jgi:hypothetical protein